MYTIILIIGFCSAISLAQWQPDLRLTNDTADSYTSNNNTWNIASNGGIVHVLWWDRRIGNYEIYYKRSMDGGLNWETDTRLTFNSGASTIPSLALLANFIHIAWNDYSDGNGEIYYKNSTDGGTSWGVDVRLTNNSANSETPCVTVSGSTVHVVWRDDRDGNFEEYYKRSTNGGINWETDTRLTNNPSISWFPSISSSAQVLHVVWFDHRDGNSEIYYKRSTDGGTTWGVDTRLTNNASISTNPSVSVSNQAVGVVWCDNRDGNQEIYYKRSSDAGLSWGLDTRLTNNSAQSLNPSIRISGPSIHVVWEDTRDANVEIYYKRSTDGGLGWEPDTRITYNSGESYGATSSISDQVVHIVWHDTRDGNREIYYKRNPTGNPFGIKIISSEIPKEFKLKQNYPNPFNPSTTIEFDIPKTTLAKLIIYDLLGKELVILFNEVLKPGTYKIDFDGSKLSSGVYFFKLQTDENAQTKTMVLLR